MEDHEMNLRTKEVEIDNLCYQSVKPVYEENIPRIEEEISYQDFFQKYLLHNRPCLISSFVTDNWQSRRLWAIGDKPNWHFLREVFGAAEVPVANCDEREFNSQKKETFTLCKYLDYLEDYINEDYPPSKPNLYLKDWHFPRDFPDANVYRVPIYFASDWLNEYFSSRIDVHDDYRFVYIGPKGSWTPLHADVFTSHSWSVNIVGRKRWVLFPPGQEVYLKDRFGNLTYDIFSDATLNTNNFLLYGKIDKSYDIIQEPGEALFVPSGWHHQVWNLEDTISINHNWVNGCNIKEIWFALQSSLSAVQQEVSDCRDMDDWDSHCQLMLRATHGLNYEEFFDLLLSIAEPRMLQLKGGNKVKMYGGWDLGQKHVIWDLIQVLETLNLMINDKNVTELAWIIEKNPNNLAKKIEHHLTSIEKNPGD